MKTRLELFVSDRFCTHLKIDDQVDLDDNREFGVVLHEVMRRIVRPADLHKAVVRSARRYELSEDQALEIESYLSERVNDARVARWFDGFERVMTERTIVMKKDKNRRPDRIVWYADGSVDIVDYKFGKEEKEYFDDVQRYMRLVSESATGPVRGYLWYVDTMIVREVKPAAVLPID